MSSQETDHEKCYNFISDPYRGSFIDVSPQAPSFLIYNDGFILPTHVGALDKYKEIAQHEFLDDDVIIATYPKCGTTLVTQIIDLLLNDATNTCNKDTGDTLMSRFPFIDIFGMPEDTASVPKLYKTHMPLDRLQYRKNKSKWMACLRNPKDCCVSYYHFSVGDKHFDYSGKFDAFFDYFCKGEVGYGSYLDWIQSCLNVIDQENVLIVLFDDLLENKALEVQRIAKFLGGRASECSDNPDKVQSIFQQTSVDAMRDSIDKILYTSFDLNGEQFIRKGQNRDWKNYFTKEQSDLMDALYAYKFKGTPSQNWFRESMRW